MNNIARIRKSKGLRQNDLAEMVGVKQPHISRIEAGDEGPPLSLYRSIAEALGVPLSELFTEARGAAEQILIEAFRDLPDARKDAWIEMAKLVQIEGRTGDQ